MLKESVKHTHYRACNLCEALCGIEVTVDGDNIISIKGDKADPFSKGHICPKATALQDVYHDPNRLKHPVKRTATGWKQISWEDAFKEVATNIRTIQKKYGRNAVGVYLGNPNVHNLGSQIYNLPFLRSLRTRNRFSATSVDQLPHQFVAYFMFGHQLLLPIPDIDRTHFFLVLGANPLASNGSLMTAPGIANRLKALQKRGGKLVVVDPRRTETAVKADQHLFIKPGSDVLLLLALLHVIYEEERTKLTLLADMVDGLEHIPPLVASFSPEKVASFIGIEAPIIKQLARDFSSAQTAVCYGRMGTSTQTFGGATQWLINVLNIVTGNLDQPGGAMFTRPAIDVIDLSAKIGSKGHYDVWRTRVRNLPEFGGELPVATLAEEILTEGEGQIKGMVTIAGNPVLSTPNGPQLEQALAGLQFMVSIDIYINETTRHANIILPTTTGLETEHYNLIFHTLAVRNTSKYSPPLFPPAPGAKHNWEILQELRTHLDNISLVDKKNKLGKTVQTLKPDLFSRLNLTKLLDLGLRIGPYGFWGTKKPSKDNLTLPKLKRAVHGIDLGPLTPCLPQRLYTANKRIQLAPELLLKDMARVEATFVATLESNGSPYNLRLIGRRDLRSNNSWMHNSLRLVKGKNRCTLLMHPTDASTRQLTEQQLVTVSSVCGSIQIPLEITEAMMPGVVCMPHGWGHTRPGTQLEIAQQYSGVSMNDLTDPSKLDQLTGNAVLNGVPVQVTG